MVAHRTSMPLSVRQRPLEFSYWPAARNRRFGRHPMLYASDPWSLMHDAVVKHAGEAEIADAQAFLRQAEEYDRSAREARAPEAKPVLHYYSFLNAAKAFIVTKGSNAVIGKVRHGLHAIPPASLAIELGQIQTIPSTQATVNAFDEFHAALTGSRIRRLTIDVDHLMAQSLYGHRLWMQSSPAHDDRFMQVEVELREDRATTTAWVNINLPETRRIGRSLSVDRVMTDGDLSASWDAVTGTIDIDGISMRVFQQGIPIPYGHRPLDAVPRLVAMVKPKLWRAIDTAAPYRRYYLYVCPTGEIRLPQLAGVYVLMYYLGSITRYQPSIFLAALDGPYGAFLREFLGSQPQQFLFGLACEFARQEISSVTGL